MSIMISFRILLLSLLLTGVSVSAQQKEVIKLWGDGVCSGKDVPTLTVYYPETPNGTAVVACPGGGYGHLALTHEGHDMAEWFTGQGVTYAVLKYRLPHAEPENYPLQDAAQAMRIMNEIAERRGLDRNRIGIMGASAGGHLAASLSTLCEDSVVRPDFQILFYPVISMAADITNKGTHDNLLGVSPTKELEERYSLDLQVTSVTPPAFIMLSADDGVSPQNSVNYFLAMQRNNVPCALHIYPSGGHGWGFKDSFKYKSQWTAELSQWLAVGI